MSQGTVETCCGQTVCPAKDHVLIYAHDSSDSVRKRYFPRDSDRTSGAIDDLKSTDEYTDTRHIYDRDAYVDDGNLRPSNAVFEHKESTERISEDASGIVRIPDMFSSIMSSRPIVNPYYCCLKPKVNRWITDLLGDDTITMRRILKADFCYLASIWAPKADEESLRTLLNWIHWGFLFDDQFDEGRFSNDLDAAKMEVHEMKAILSGDANPCLTNIDDPIRDIFVNTWAKVKTRCNASFQSHWKAMHHHYFDGLLAQVAAQVGGHALTQSVDEYTVIRRGTVGVLPAIAATEFALGTDLPQAILSHPSIYEYVELGVEHNVISLLTKQGVSVQEAMDRIGHMLDECYGRWYAALASLPVLGEAMDRSILQVVETCRDVALGNLHWSFKTARYLGADGAQLQQTRLLRLIGGFRRD